MIVTNDEELTKLKVIGKICAITLKEMRAAVEPGITTKELDDLGGQILARYGAVSGPIACYEFPGYTCISINEEIAHGIPGSRVIKAGDLVNIDVSASLDDYFGDTAASFFVGDGDKAGLHMLKTCHLALEKAIAAAIAGRRLNTVSKVVEDTAKKAGLKTIRNLCGHGVGKTLHDEPEMINNYYDPMDRRKLEKGMVIAIEPFIAEKESYVVQDEKDGWTLRTLHWTRAAQCEHTIVVTDKKPIILTSLV